MSIPLFPLISNPVSTAMSLPVDTAMLSRVCTPESSTSYTNEPRYRLPAFPLDMTFCSMVRTLAPTLVPSPRKVYVIVLVIFPTVSLAIMGKLRTLWEICKRLRLSQTRIRLVTLLRLPGKCAHCLKFYGIAHIGNRNILITSWLKIRMCSIPLIFLVVSSGGHSRTPNTLGETLPKSYAVFATKWDKKNQSRAACEPRL